MSYEADLLTRCVGRLKEAPARRRARGFASFGVGAVFLRKTEVASTGRLATNRKLSFGVVLLLSCSEIVCEDELDCPSGLDSVVRRSFLPVGPC